MSLRVIHDLLGSRTQGLHDPTTYKTSDYCACIHRGEKIDCRWCRGCASSREPTDVFACDIHGKCALRQVTGDRCDAENINHKRDESIAVCVGCQQAEWPD